MATLWFGAAYLTAALGGLLLAARGVGTPLGLPLDGVRGTAVAAAGAVAVLVARGRRTLRHDLPLTLVGGLAALALIGLVHSA
jgi:hypothetical protein